MNPTELNIANLTGLWTLVGETFKGFAVEDKIFSASIEHAEWPNRVWTRKPINNKTAAIVKSKMYKNKALTFSYFRTDNVNHVTSYFKLKSKQYGMSLALDQKFRVNNTITLTAVTNAKQAILWNDAFCRSFGYNISSKTIIKTCCKVQYYIAYNNNDIIGTVVLFRTQNVVGIHSLGILPEKRKQGFASEIMTQILNLSIDQNVKLATLQASKMAKAIYLKMGFSQDFLLENYKLESAL